MFKRPNPRVQAKRPCEFVSHTLPNGATSSFWTPANAHTVIPSGHSSRVGEILDKMRNGILPPPEKRWAPPIDYKFIAARMDNPEPFIKRCEDWFAAHPPKVYTPPPPPPVIHRQPIIDVFAKYGTHMPPISELEKAWRAAGYPEERIAKALAWHAKMDATTDERQKVLDTIFAKFPSANKPTPKPKPTKVIKVVKKKLPQNTNE